MPITRNTRTHLVYQFIILAILFFFIGYYELWPERKGVFLFFIPLLLFQLIILFYCTELLPTPRLVNESNSSSEALCTEMETHLAGLKSPERQDNTEKWKRTVEPGENSETKNSNAQPRVYKFRNWKKDPCNETNSIVEPTSFDASAIKAMEKFGEFNFGNCDHNQLTESESTKRYFFPYRQKRLEQWIESKESVRPNKITNLEVNSCDGSKSGFSSEVTSTQISDEISSSLSSARQGPEMPKSYSFPFRHRRLEQWMEIKENDAEKSDIVPSVPLWQNAGYSSTVKEKARRRKSFCGSTPTLNRQSELTETNEKHKDFSQSVEISNISNLCVIDSKPTKAPLTTFSRIKGGFNNYLAKIKKENGKMSVFKQVDTKRRSFKNVFLPKESVCPEAGRHESVLKTLSNLEHTRPPSLSSSSYTSFEKQSFEEDVQKTISGIV